MDLRGHGVGDDQRCGRSTESSAEEERGHGEWKILVTNARRTEEESAGGTEGKNTCPTERDADVDTCTWGKV
jgi:hypothetical protein